jgi:hypothetical protein
MPTYFSKKKRVGNFSDPFKLFGTNYFLITTFSVATVVPSVIVTW